MGVFYQEEQSPRNPSRKCKLLLASTLREAFANCRSCGGHLSPLQHQQQQQQQQEEDDYVDYVPNATTDLEVDEQEEVVVSVIRSRAMEKSKQKVFVITDSFSGQLFFSPATKEKNGEGEKDEEFFSVGSCLSCCSSNLSRGGDEFFSVKTNMLSRCSSFSQVEEFPSFHRRVSILQELCHCEGWPFGLCRKAVLLPPLPKSPSESWLWRKDTRSARLS